MIEEVRSGFIADCTAAGMSKRMRSAERAEVWGEMRRRRWPFIEVGKEGGSFYVEGNGDPLTDWHPGVGLSVEQVEQLRELWRSYDLKRTGMLSISTAAHVYAQGMKVQNDARRFAFTWQRLLIDNAVRDVQRQIDAEQKEKQMVKFFKDGKALALQTDSNNEQEFTNDFGMALQDYMTSPNFEGGYELNSWLDHFHQIRLKMAGYKVESVREQRLLTVGEVNPTSETCVNITEHGTQVLKAIA